MGNTTRIDVPRSVLIERLPKKLMDISSVARRGPIEYHFKEVKPPDEIRFRGAHLRSFQNAVIKSSFIGTISLRELDQHTTEVSLVLKFTFNLYSLIGSLLGGIGLGSVLIGHLLLSQYMHPVLAWIIGFVIVNSAFYGIGKIIESFDQYLVFERLVQHPVELVAKEFHEKDPNYSPILNLAKEQALEEERWKHPKRSVPWVGPRPNYLLCLIGLVVTIVLSWLSTTVHWAIFIPLGFFSLICYGVEIPSWGIERHPDRLVYKRLFYRRNIYYGDIESIKLRFVLLKNTGRSTYSNGVYDGSSIRYRLKFELVEKSGKALRFEKKESLSFDEHSSEGSKNSLLGKALGEKTRWDTVLKHPGLDSKIEVA
ncbi:MAG: hypothetical protein JW839_09670 [Candidatus Lokiarchaeota archaeon]|nr:hypothetical protein [Candidatus Lokiarchaeota archaeon]